MRRLLLWRWMGTGPPLVPKSNVIPDNPRLSVLRPGGIQRATFRSPEPKTPPPRAIAFPYRTQEVAGSSPASSIAEAPTQCRAGVGEPSLRTGQLERWDR